MRLHLFRSDDINAPLPGTYNAAVPGSGVFPLGGKGPVLLMESSGLYNQNQFIANVNAKVKPAVSLFGFYVLNHALSNTDGIGTSPANHYNYAGEYGPASTDVQHRVTAGGSVALRWSVRLSPYLVAQSGAPFDITSGDDLYGTTLFNSRPGFANDPLKPGLIADQLWAIGPAARRDGNSCAAQLWPRTGADFGESAHRKGFRFWTEQGERCQARPGRLRPGAAGSRD